MYMLLRLVQNMTMHLANRTVIVMQTWEGVQLLRAIKYGTRSLRKTKAFLHSAI